MEEEADAQKEEKTCVLSSETRSGIEPRSSNSQFGALVKKPLSYKQINFYSSLKLKINVQIDYRHETATPLC